MYPIVTSQIILLQYSGVITIHWQGIYSWTLMSGSHMCGLSIVPQHPRSMGHFSNHGEEILPLFLWHCDWYTKTFDIRHLKSKISKWTRAEYVSSTLFNHIYNVIYESHDLLISWFTSCLRKQHPEIQGIVIHRLQSYTAFQPKVIFSLFTALHLIIS